MSQSEAKQPIPAWVPGDKGASEKFQQARVLAEAAGRSARGAIVWGGSAAVFVAATFLGAPGDPASALSDLMAKDGADMSVFDWACLVGGSYCVLVALCKGALSGLAKLALRLSLADLGAAFEKVSKAAGSIEGGEPTEPTRLALAELARIQGKESGSAGQ